MYLFLYDLWCWLEKKRYRLLCMLLSERELGDRKVGERKVVRGRWVIGCVFLCENGKKKETSWDKVERHKVNDEK